MNDRLRDFWAEADAARLVTEKKANVCMRTLETAPIATVRRVLVQYRYFTFAYITDLAQLVAKMPFGRLRTFLAEILSEELGGKDPAHSHPELYDAFLRSIGIEREEEMSPMMENIRVLGDLSEELVQSPFAYGIGLRGMGGECLCQTYLANLYSYFRTNPEIVAREATIDWRFWDIHVGPIDLAHVEQTKAAINDLVVEYPRALPELIAGYRRSIRAWDAFWDTTFAGEKKPSRASFAAPTSSRDMLEPG